MKQSTARRMSSDGWTGFAPHETAKPGRSLEGVELTTVEAVYQAVTANRVRDGLAIYRTPTGHWSRNIDEAGFVKDAGDMLAAAKADLLTAISPYVIDVKVKDHRVRPIGLREEIRAFGPTV